MNVAIATPLVPSDPLVLALLTLLLGCALVCAWEYGRWLCRSWRNQRQVEMDVRMRRGFEELRRRGYFDQDDIR